MEDDFEILMPFAIRSQVVTRFQPLPIISNSPLSPLKERYGPDFWERLIRQPCVCKTGVCGAISSYPVWRANEELRSLNTPSLETLPPPSELCRGKRRKKKLGNEKRVMAVQHHIQELRQKQSSLEQQRAMKCRGYEIPDFKFREEAQTDVANVRDQQEDLPYFLDITGDHRDDCIRVFSTSPQQGPFGVVFPWMSAADDVSSCYLDSDLETHGAPGGLF
ncbi:protein INCA1-like [Pseudophryne corroboree]|uniref:protein INCA1-like n=1 Tax=Pseudophryne corroboree TaxID=495146 RepID=UPI003081661E